MPRGPMGPKGRQSIDKPKDFKKTTKKLINSYLSKYKIALLVVFIFAIGGTIFTIVGPKILGNATTEVFNGIISKISGGAGIDFGKIARNSNNFDCFICYKCDFLIYTRLYYDRSITKNNLYIKK